MNAETLIQQEIRLAIGGRPDVRIFRNTVGTGWVGERVLRPSHAMMMTVHPGDAVIYGARPLHAGLCVGSPDLFGWRRVVVTADMVGQPLAVTVGLEVKTPAGRLTTQQTAFLSRLVADGGLAGAARSVDDARRIVDQL